jgi:hypothetical protein
MVYEKYLEQFDKIGYSENRIVTISNFINKNSLALVNHWLKECRAEGGIDRNNIDNQEVINILIDSEKRIYDQICQHYAIPYNVDFDYKAYIPSHLIKWNLGYDKPMPVHSDCERPDGSPAMHDGYYKYNLAAICYLNDEYVGGKIFFPEFNKEIKPNAGDLIMFPGKFKHGVTGVISGDRHTMLTWFRFNVEDNIADEDLPYSGTALGVLFNNETGS